MDQGASRLAVEWAPLCLSQAKCRCAGSSLPVPEWSVQSGWTLLPALLPARSVSCGFAQILFALLYINPNCSSDTRVVPRTVTISLSNRILPYNFPKQSSKLIGLFLDLSWFCKIYCLCSLLAFWKILKIGDTIVDRSVLVDAVTWQLLNHAVGHPIKVWGFFQPQVLDDFSNLVTFNYRYTGFELSAQKYMEISSDQFIMFPGFRLQYHWN